MKKTKRIRMRGVSGEGTQATKARISEFVSQGATSSDLRVWVKGQTSFS